MKRFCRILSIATMILCSSAMLSARTPSFFFIQISDPQMGFFDKNKSLTQDSLHLAQAVAHINRLKPAFVVVTGDMVNTPRNRRQIDTYKGLISRIDPDIAVYHIPGNHDTGRTNDLKHVEAYKAEFGNDRFSFRYGNCAFIGIHSGLIKDSNETLEIEQYQWLEQELKKARKCTYRFVFTHCPVFVSRIDEEDSYSNLASGDRQRYWALFEKYNVNAVIAGHLHNHKEAECQGIDMITCGPVGRALGTGFSGIRIWKVNDENYSSTYFSLDEVPETVIP